MPRLASRPQRCRGAKARGRTFERRVLSELSRLLPPPAQLLPRQWFKYGDEEGVHFAQADCIILVNERCVIVEAKLSNLEMAKAELALLYGPLCARVWDLPQVHLAVCKYWPEGGFKVDSFAKGDGDGVLVLSPEEACESEGFCVWHYVG